MTYIEYLQTDGEVENAEKLAKLESIAKMMVNGCNRGELMNLVFGEDKSKVDSAYPSPYADEIRKIYPNFNKGNYCYSYIDNHFGEMVNLNDKIVEWIFK